MSRTFRNQAYRPKDPMNSRKTLNDVIAETEMRESLEETEEDNWNTEPDWDDIFVIPSKS